jgi:hypothetical protein
VNATTSPLTVTFTLLPPLLGAPTTLVAPLLRTAAMATRKTEFALLLIDSFVAWT